MLIVGLVAAAIILTTIMGITMYDIKLIQRIKAGRRRLKSPYKPLPKLVNLSHFFTTYYFIGSSIFQKSRIGLGISPKPLTSRSLSRQRWNKIYKSTSFVATFITPLTISYALFMAISMRQPSMLALILLGFLLFMSLAVWLHERLSISRKLFYLAMLPTSIGFFFIISWKNLLEMLADVIKAVIPIGISLFMRIKDIRRVVE